jgi:hypothetical protein
MGRGLSEASEGLARTLGAVGRATRTAAEFEGRMTVLGLNAILLSSRLGTEGRAMVEVAQQLRDIARSITEVIAQIRLDIEAIADTAGGLDVPEDEALAQRLAAAAEAAAEVSRLADGVGGHLREMDAIRRGGDLAQGFWTAEKVLDDFALAAAALEPLAAALDPPGEAPGPLPASLREALQPIRRLYTMQSERDLHDALLRGDPPGVSAETPAADDVLFA